MFGSSGAAQARTLQPPPPPPGPPLNPSQPSLRAQVPQFLSPQVSPAQPPHPGSQSPWHCPAARWGPCPACHCGLQAGGGRGAGSRLPARTQVPTPAPSVSCQAAGRLPSPQQVYSSGRRRIHREAHASRARAAARGVEAAHPHGARNHPTPVLGVGRHPVGSMAAASASPHLSGRQLRRRGALDSQGQAGRVTGAGASGEAEGRVPT